MIFMHIFWQISQIEILADTENTFLTYMFNGYFEIFGTEIGNYAP